MRPMSEKGEWMLREIAELALSDPVRALEVIAPRARYLDGAYLRVACDLLEMARGADLGGAGPRDRPGPRLPRPAGGRGRGLRPVP